MGNIAVDKRIYAGHPVRLDGLAFPVSWRAHNAGDQRRPAAANMRAVTSIFGAVLRGLTLLGVKKVREPEGSLTCWVADGTRTRDSQDHNLVLYQLNYSHHCRKPARRY